MLGGMKRKAAPVARFASAQWGCLSAAPLRGDDCRRARCILYEGLRLTMANNPKKAKDPTEVALSAIQEALNISESSADANRNAEATDLSPPPVMPPAATSFEPAFEPRTSA